MLACRSLASAVHWACSRGLTVRSTLSEHPVAGACNNYVPLLCKSTAWGQVLVGLAYR